MGRELEPAGIMTEGKTYKFAFNKFEKQFESFNGVAVNLRFEKINQIFFACDYS